MYKEIAIQKEIFLFHFEVQKTWSWKWKCCWFEVGKMGELDWPTEIWVVCLAFKATSTAPPAEERCFKDIHIWLSHGTVTSCQWLCLTEMFQTSILKEQYLANLRQFEKMDLELWSICIKKNSIYFLSKNEMWLIIYLSVFVFFNIVQSEYYDIRTTTMKLKSISPSIHPSIRPLRVISSDLWCNKVIVVISGVPWGGKQNKTLWPLQHWHQYMDSLLFNMLSWFWLTGQPPQCDWRTEGTLAHNRFSKSHSYVIYWLCNSFKGIIPLGSGCLFVSL